MLPSPSVADLAKTLLAEPTAEARADRLQEAGVADLAEAIQELGRRREPAAAEVLRLIDAVTPDRALRKAARRELHRLESAGIHAPAAIDLPRPAPAPAAPTERRGVRLREAWATDIDPSGSRAVWLLGEPPLGGAWLAAMVLNEDEGLTDLSLIDTTRKRYQRELDQQRRDPRATWVALPPEYALELVREAVDTARSQDRGLPTRYRSFTDLFGEADHAPERALVYATVSPLEVNLHPEALAESARLIREPEVAGWHLAVSDDLRTRAAEVARGPGAALLVPGHPPEQQALRLLVDAARQALTAHRRHALRRRLEETGSIFVATDRLPAARLAVAAARAVQDPSLAPERHPFLRLLLTAGLVSGLRAERSGSGRNLAERLVELIERAVEREAGRGPEATTTTPTGLILPR
jgi:hypothetical protein